MDNFVAILIAAAVGGLFCILGQVLIDFTKFTPARILTAFVVLGVIVYAVGWYEPLKDLAGAGASVPLLGFGATLARGVKEAFSEKGAVGILSGGLIATAAGISAAISCGVIAAFLRKPKGK